MSQLNLNLPIIGDPNATEDPKVRTALSDIQTVVNSLDNANIASNAGINGSKLLDASIPQSKLALGPTYETSLPGSPVDGQEIYYAADAANGVIWHLRYRSGASGSYKWEFVGGAQLYAQNDNNRHVSSTSFADLPTDQIFVSIPLAGEYVVSQAAFANVNATTTFGALSFAITNSSDAISGSGTAEATDVRSLVIETNSTNPGFRANLLARNVVEITTATYRIRERGRVGSNSVAFARRRLFVTPIRVG